MTRIAAHAALSFATLAVLVSFVMAPAEAAVMSRTATIEVSATVLPQAGAAQVQAPHATSHVIVSDLGKPAIDQTTITY